MPKSLPDELYHYTGINGLKGIVENQTLWASHYKYLNDAEEIIHFRKRLPKILRPIFKEFFSGLTPESMQILLANYGSIDEAIEEEPKNLATKLYNATFVGAQDDPPFAEPYITSFCSVDQTDNYVADHGLLSQWRGYGTEGGYAITFDTAELSQLVTEEKEKWGYPVFGGDIVYGSATDKQMHEEFYEHIDVIQKSWEQWLRTGNREVLGNTYHPFIACACRYKHRGFAEEREVRIIAVPTPPQVFEIAKADGRTIPAKKPVHHFLRNGTFIPYLNLFQNITGSSGKQLPIKRIIVGPHPEKEKRKTAIKSLLNQNNIQADVCVSEIPYLG